MKKRILCFVSALAVSFGMLLNMPSIVVQAATFEDINRADMFQKQAQGSVTCTLVSASMLVRRALMMLDSPNWKYVSEDTMRSTAWIEGVGLYNEFTYNGVKVSSGYFTSVGKEAQLLALLSVHPEGVVVYDYGYPHAILITDYSDGIFYCSDPASHTAQGRIPVSQAIITIDSIDKYWYVASPVLTLDGAEPLNGEVWEINVDSGCNVRDAAGLSGNKQFIWSKGTQFLVTEKVTADGYTWGKTASGWVALDYCKYISGTIQAEKISLTQSGITVSQISNQKYTGSEIRPSVTVKNGSVTLVENKDYTLSYSDNVNIGTAAVTITGIGNYEGTLVKEFEIYIDVIYGDINSDGAANDDDVQLLFMYNSGHAVTINKENADINEDGKISGKDAMLLFKYNSGRNTSSG